MITAVGVVIPARDEVERVAACLRSLRRALLRAPGVDCAVHLVLDRCTDGTAGVVSEMLAGRPGWSWDVSIDDLPVGRLRDAGARVVLDRLAGHDRARTWLLSTDADTTVPPDWVVRHLDHARKGTAAVCGVVELSGGTPLPPDAAERYRRLVDAQRGRHRHTHVYGANLGVRADAYGAVGGFAPMATGEDRDLVTRLLAAGHPVAHPLDVRVRTSSRLDGRARGGLADLLSALHEGVAAG